MAKAITLTFDARLGPAVQQFIQATQKVQHMEGAVKKLTQATGKAATELEKTGQVADKTSVKAQKFSGEMGISATKLLSLAGGAISAGTAINMFRAALEAAKQEAEEAGQHLVTLEAGMKRIVQVSATAAQARQKNLAADLLSMEYGIPRAESRDLQFQVESFGISERGLAAIAKASEFADPAQLAEIVGSFQSPAVFGRAEAGSAKQIISKVVAAAERSKFDIAGLGLAALETASAAGRVSTTDEELLAILSATSAAYTSPQRLATRTRAVGEVLAKGFERETGRKIRDPISGNMVAEKEQIKFDQAGILQGLQTFATKYPEEFQKVLMGRAEFAEAYEAIRKAIASGDLAERIKEVTAAQSGEPFERKLRIARADPVLQAAKAQRQVEAAKQVQDQLRGLKELKYQQEQDETELMLEQRGVGAFGKWWARSAFGMHRFLLGADIAIRNMQAGQRRGGYEDEGDTPLDRSIQNLEQALRENAAPPPVPGGVELRPLRADDHEGQVGQGTVLIGDGE